ncbi:TadG family pilus assembly protein [Geoalkalibacter halelectricus]|uniref:Pilus assembly protein TadG-related protein n=1 Tax=Geoalkalibacter halelectricus TaxID=2847045 RepID=A0ABY5ZP12_9BACT|nr:TadG family pilus assembly protein [Geoalkalibacter halelectricus]MDO3378431.1 pilus assembly protein TadG-related protein [Geoalkalibacter halelectricus]UWZ80249.1 pilus assembly protein TadG-related protein [Geoalkalibacter halelectricus]
MNLRMGATRTMRQERGAVLVMVAVLMTVFIGITALAIDLGHLHVVRNELQNAADAGALAGAANLINYSTGAIRADANQIAYDTALLNSSVNQPVEVNWTSGNEGDVQRGHWSFATRTFTPNASLVQADLEGRSEAVLDADTNFINAVRVVTRREADPAPSFFAGFFGFGSFARTAEAVAYIGFAGQVEPYGVDQPIAICQESILQNAGEPDAYFDCNIGRMINSGQNVVSSNTAGWTDFNQAGNPCQGGTNANAVRDLVCGEGNPLPIALGRPMATSGGEIQSAFNNLTSCWESATGKEQPWTLTLSVIECPGNNVSTCQKVVGVVTVEIVWINAQNDPQYNRVPTQMGDWSSDASSGQARWASFVEHFNLKNVDGSPAPYANKSIYFKPSCEYQEPPLSHTGGKNFGLLAQIPVLVR